LESSKQVLQPFLPFLPKQGKENISETRNLGAVLLAEWNVRASSDALNNLFFSILSFSDLFLSEIFDFDMIPLFFPEAIEFSKTGKNLAS